MAYKSTARKRKREQGRQETRPFIALVKEWLLSPEWAELSPTEIKLFIDLASQYNGKNNGDFCATWQMMKKRGWRSPGTLSAAIKGLIAKGWLELTRQGGRNHIPSLYALNIWKIDECGGKLDVAATALPSMRWKKPKKLVAPRIAQPLNDTPADQNKQATGVH